MQLELGALHDATNPRWSLHHALMISVEPAHKTIQVRTQEDSVR